jgi:cell division protein FtsW
VTETRRREARAYRRSPIRFLMPYFRFAAIFFLFFGSIVVGVKDFSPLVILAVILLAWLWKLGGSQGEFYKRLSIWRFVRPLALLVIVGFVGGMVWVYHHPHQVPEGFPKRDRILVWAQPELHPHSGTQVLDSMDLVGRGGWLGAKPWFGRNGGVMRLAAVQDDFITAFLINRFGGYAGLAMLFAQIFYALLLFTLGKVLERQLGEGDFREQNAGVVLGYTLYGVAWMLVAQWLISWGNTLGLLPVMGQPMTWLTAGNSHLIAVALLPLFIALVSGWVSLGYSEEEREAKRKRGIARPSRQQPQRQKIEPRLA